MLRQFQSCNLFIWSIVFIGCICSRLFTTIYYIEDLDSLRFALSMVEYDVTKLQPHFPAYPVFCFIAKLLYILIRRYALSFSLIGGLSTFFIIFFTLKIAKIECTTMLGIFATFIIIMNPLLWLMSNRYMPDAMGVACLMASLYFITAHMKGSKKTSWCFNTIGFFLAGILLGIRLSYLPLLLPALVIQLLKHQNRLKYIVAGTFGMLVWLIPLLWITGWGPLITAAQTQSQGHFSDFGGTVSTYPALLLRLTKIIESVFADGFGLYWIGRHPITICTTIILIAVIVLSYWQTVRRWIYEKGSVDRLLSFNPIILGCVLYLIWIFFAQNIIHKSRHVLPLLPFLALGIAFSGNRIIAFHKTKITAIKNQIRMINPFACGIVIIFLICYSYVSLHTVVLHTKPTAIAQIHKYLQNKQDQQSNKLQIVSVPLITYYMDSQALTAEYITIMSDEDLTQLEELQTGFTVIGGALPNRVPKVEKTFYHNPYVNRMWSEIPLYEY